ncbi:MAG: hypothetical protein RL385_1419 [Pseudomonadota bacterium]|jgi:acetyl esterase/lipase
MNPFDSELRFGALLAKWMPPVRVLRALQRLQGVTRPPRVAGLEIHDERIEARDGTTLRVRVYRREGAAKRPGLLWIHGGGYVMGTPEMHEKTCLAIARDEGIQVVSVSYRLAPAWPFPTPLEDCYSALRWMQRHADRLGIDCARLAVGGVSAGGGLAAALAQLAHDRAEVPVMFQLLIYPMLDDRTALREDIDPRRLRLWSKDDNRFGWTSYLGHTPGLDIVRRYAVPSRRERLEGLPRAWVGTGTCDLFLDEDVAYAQRLSAADVDCTLYVAEGAYHGFDIVQPSARVSRDFSTAYRTALGKALGTCR